MTQPTIIAIVYILGLVAIAHTLGQHPLVGILWAFGAASMGFLIYVAYIILTA
jgi:hypothetical protein